MTFRPGPGRPSASFSLSSPWPSNRDPEWPGQKRASRGSQEGMLLSEPLVSRGCVSLRLLPAGGLPGFPALPSPGSLTSFFLDVTNTSDFLCCLTWPL